MEPLLSVFADHPSSLDRGTPGPRAAKTRADPAAALTGVAVLFAAVLTQMMFSVHFWGVWRQGTFFDTDDAMRMVQVRDFVAGQSWYDMTAYRLDPPSGIGMHWSRFPDLPLAILVQAFGLVTDATTAERLARIAFPFALLLGLYYGVARLAETLLGPVARLPAIGTTLFCGCAIVQFQPGRIDHHAPQIVSLAVMAWAATEALDPAKARRAMMIGGLMGLSLAISLENLPFIISLSGLLVALWIWHGAAMDRMLLCFALGLFAGLPLSFGAIVAPAHWFDPVCDAFGAAHLGAGLIGAAGCAGLAVASPRLPTRWHRLAGAAGAGVLAAAYVAFAYPACLHDPFAMVAPLVRTIWLDNVGESQPLLRFLAKTPTSGLLSLMPVALGLCGVLAAAALSRGLTASRFLLVGGMITAGLAMSFWQIRVLTSVTPLAVCGALPLAIALHHRLRRGGLDLAALLALCLVFPFTSLAWLLVLPDDPPGAARPATACLAAPSFAALATLPLGRAIAPIDSGSYLLAHTGLSVFAGPYHRDNNGNLLAFESMLAKPDDARAMLAAKGANYVMLCRGFGETEGLAARAPDGLAAALLAGHPPAWLTPLAVPDTPYTVYRVAPPAKG